MLLVTAYAIWGFGLALVASTAPWLIGDSKWAADNFGQRTRLRFASSLGFFFVPSTSILSSWYVAWWCRENGLHENAWALLVVMLCSFVVNAVAVAFFMWRKHQEAARQKIELGNA